MSELVAYVGAALLAAATIPQAGRLWRTRRAEQFSWGFILLNFAGITVLAWYSGVIREWALLTVNSVTGAFWALAFMVKVARETVDPHPGIFVEAREDFRVLYERV